MFELEDPAPPPEPHAATTLTWQVQSAIDALCTLSFDPQSKLEIRDEGGVAAFITCAREGTPGHKTSAAQALWRMAFDWDSRLQVREALVDCSWWAAGVYLWLNGGRLVRWLLRTSVGNRELGSGGESKGGRAPPLPIGIFPKICRCWRSRVSRPSWSS